MWLLFSPQDIIDIHDNVLNPGELIGQAGDKSLPGMLGRIDSRLQYSQIQDIFDLAAAYALAIAQGHVFNDANKRTAFAAMDLCLCNHGIQINWDVSAVGDMIILVAQGHVDETELAAWLRQRTSTANEVRDETESDTEAERD